MNRSYIVKISNSKYRGEYTGGRTVGEAVRQAKSMLPDLERKARVTVGYFTFGKKDPEDGRYHVSKVIQEGEWGFFL